MPWAMMLLHRWHTPSYQGPKYGPDFPSSQINNVPSNYMIKILYQIIFANLLEEIL